MNWPPFNLGQESAPKLTADSVHVWRVSTAAADHEGSRVFEVLSTEEVARAARFHFEKDRRSFGVCRSMLRTLLGAYSAENPAAIRFAYGEHGKPELQQPAMPELKFNVSHSGELALLAFAWGREVGVDIEKKRPDVDFAGLANVSFSRAERDDLLSHAPDARGDIFYEYWSCKEACIKADGRGLSAGLRGFSVVRELNFAERDRPAWRQVTSSKPGTVSADIRIKILSEDDGYAAAVAAVGMDWDVQQFSASIEGPNPV